MAKKPMAAAEPAETKSYIVLRPVRVEGKFRAAGARVDLDAGEGDALVKRGALKDAPVEELAKPEPPPAS